MAYSAGVPNYCVTDAVMNTREATGRLLAVESLAEVQ
jgi:hypothetical protein